MAAKASFAKNLDLMDVREFPNNLPDYDGFDPIFDIKGNLNQGVFDPISKCILRLLSAIDTRAPKEVPSNKWSVYTGTTGIALTYMHAVDKKELFMRSEEKEFLMGCRGIDDCPASYAKALQFVEKSMPDVKHTKFSFMCGSPGPLTVACLLYHKMGKQRESDRMFQRILELKDNALANNEDVSDELLYGRIGYLYSLLFIRQEMCIDKKNDKIIQQVVDVILHYGKRQAKKFKKDKHFPLYYEWHNKAYVGAAHGFTGILYVLLHAKEFITDDDLTNFVKPFIDQILSLQFPSGNFPSSLENNKDRLVHWCHGAPGVIHLMLLAYKTFLEEKYLDSARRCADIIWERGLLKKGYGLCHGVAGNGYAFIHAFQITRDMKYLHRAIQFGLWCCNYGKHDVRTPDHPLSLMEGMAGTVYFLIDLLSPKEAVFPGFQLKDFHSC